MESIWCVYVCVCTIVLNESYTYLLYSIKKKNEKKKQVLGEVEDGNMLLCRPALRDEKSKVMEETFFFIMFIGIS